MRSTVRLSTLGRQSDNALRSERGFALPVALLLLLIVAAVGGVLANNSLGQMSLSLGQEGTQDTLHVSEGAVHEILREMAVQPESWKALSPLAGTQPSGYTSYQPLSYTATNGIPSCSGAGCLRSMYPIGGGLLKNFGPLSGEGSQMDSSYSIDQQLDPDNPPQADVTLNNLPAWVQLERMDTVFSAEDSLGADLDSQGDGWGNAEVVRFRVTGQALRQIKTRRGTSTVVVLVELPSV